MKSTQVYAFDHRELNRKIKKAKKYQNNQLMACFQLVSFKLIKAMYDDNQIVDY